MSFGSRSLPPPTAEQKRRWALMKERGCVCCRILALPWDCGTDTRHHLTVGGKHGAPRLGHDFTLLLCEWHHLGKAPLGETAEESEHEYGPSYAKTPKAFRREFGNDAHLLEYQNVLIGWTKEPQRERKRKSRCTAAANQVKRPTGGFAP